MQFCRFVTVKTHLKLILFSNSVVFHKCDQYSSSYLSKSKKVTIAYVFNQNVAYKLKNIFKPNEAKALLKTKYFFMIIR